jgi:large subunit ribosomal protein L4
MAKMDMVNSSNEKVESLDLQDEIFSVEVKPHLFWEVVRNQMANRRSGTKKTKSRAEVNYTGAKLYRQKGTGRSRAGSARSGVRVGGGHIFALRPKDWSYKTPKKVRRQAVVSALAMKLAESKLTVVDSLSLDRIKTSDMAAILKSLDVQNGLIVIGQRDEKIEKSAKNIPFVKVLPVEGLNLYDILRYDKLILTKDAVEKIEGRYKKR